MGLSIPLPFGLGSPCGSGLTFSPSGATFPLTSGPNDVNARCRMVANVVVCVTFIYLLLSWQARGYP